MATFSLSGTGTHTLSAGTTALHVTISTLPASAGHGDASPADYYGVGLLRLGDGTAYWDPYPVSGGPQWLPVPYGASVVGYSLLGGAVISITEVTASSPLAVPLSGLPDVAIGSPADTQVLTYQGSSGHWINAAAPSGGGGGGSISYQRTILTVDQGVGTAGYVDALTLALAAGTWLLLGQVQCTINSQAAMNARITDGTNTLSQADITLRTGTDTANMFVHCVTVVATTTTMHLQWMRGTNIILWSSTPRDSTKVATQFTALKLA